MSAPGDERRATPLAVQLAREIAAGGPIGIDAYMRRCLADPVHGYYRSQQAIGRAGDFITAPEISQVFGELIGLWTAVVWQQMGAPARFNLVELGPGRGQLIADALRAARIVPGFSDAVELHLCEINPTLRAAQRAQLEAIGRADGATWHAAWPSCAGHPTVVVANEFLDTLPGTQWQQAPDGGWVELRVTADDDARLVFTREAGRPPFEGDAAVPPSPGPDAVLTHADFAGIAGDLAAQASRAPMAALFIDYGHTATAWGDTLQAVRAHEYEHPLCSPGEADLSLAVDFAAFARALDGAGLALDGPVTQAAFLGQLGIAERASKLMAANPGRAGEIEAAVLRLMAVPGMGARFHVIAARSPGLAALPGFASQTP